MCVYMSIFLQFTPGHMRVYMSILLQFTPGHMRVYMSIFLEYLYLDISNIWTKLEYVNRRCLQGGGKDKYQ